MKRNSVGVAKQTRSKAASTEAKQSSRSAAQPAKHAPCSFRVPRSAAQPAKHAPCSFRVPRECSDWLQALPEHVIAQSQPLKRVHSATAVLELSSTREQRDQIQALLNDWNVPQKPPGMWCKKRTFDDVKADLVSKVVAEIRRLKRMHNATEASTPDAPPPPAWAKYCAIQAAFLRDSNQ